MNQSTSEKLSRIELERLRENTMALEQIKAEAKKKYNYGYPQGVCISQKELDALIDSTHQATVEEIIKIAEGMKYGKEVGLDAELESYNSALTDLIKAIKK
jgi:hypothetical protein